MYLNITNVEISCTTFQCSRRLLLDQIFFFFEESVYWEIKVHTWVNRIISYLIRIHTNEFIQMKLDVFSHLLSTCFLDLFMVVSGIASISIQPLTLASSNRNTGSLKDEKSCPIHVYPCMPLTWIMCVSRIIQQDLDYVMLFNYTGYMYGIIALHVCPFLSAFFNQSWSAVPLLRLFQCLVLCYCNGNKSEKSQKYFIQNKY